MSTQVHYRTLSGSLSSRNSISYRPSLDLKFPDGDDDDSSFDHETLLRDGFLRQRLPRNYRCLRTSAFIGWIVSIALFIALVVSHSTIAPPLRPLDLGMLRLRAGGGRAGASKLDVMGGRGVRIQKAVAGAGAGDGHGEKELAYPDRAEGLQSRVTIVSGFYQIDSWKKHRVSGAFMSVLLGKRERRAD
jgi:hypothetical protein